MPSTEQISSTPDEPAHSDIIPDSVLFRADLKYSGKDKNYSMLNGGVHLRFPNNLLSSPSDNVHNWKGEHITPHSLRHTAAMTLLRKRMDRGVIALWLGHESVETTYVYYLHADLKLKEQAMAKTKPSDMRPVRYQPDDELLAFLNSL